MPSRRLPKTKDERSKALKACADKVAITPEPQRLITPAQNTSLQGTLSSWRNTRNAAAQSLEQQTKCTAQCDTAQTRTTRAISHFIQVLNFAIERGELLPSDRAHYKLPVAHAEVPALTALSDVFLWAEHLRDGENARTSEGGPPMAWPTIATINTETTQLTTLHQAQSNAKTTYDIHEQNITEMTPGVDHLIKDLWDTIEYNLRHEPDQASLRRKAREWGVFYENDPEAPEEPTGPANPSEPPAEPTPPAP